MLQILSEVDTILFSLLILGGLTDSQGHVWRCHSGQLYAVELTLPENQVCSNLICYVQFIIIILYLNTLLTLHRSKVLK